MTQQHFSVFWLPKAGGRMSEAFRTETVERKKLIRLYDMTDKEIHSISCPAPPSRSMVLRYLISLIKAPAPELVDAELNNLISQGILVRGWRPHDFDYYAEKAVVGAIAYSSASGFVELIETQDYVGRVDAFFRHKPSPTYEELKEIALVLPRTEGILETQRKQIEETFCEALRNLIEPRLAAAGRDEAKLLKQQFGYVVSAAGLVEYDRVTGDALLTVAALQPIKDKLKEKTGTTTRRMFIPETSSAANGEEHKFYFSKLIRDMEGLSWSNAGKLETLAREYRQGLEKYKFAIGQIPADVRMLGDRIKRAKESMEAALGKRLDVDTDW